jgi:hypothetical protein
LIDKKGARSLLRLQRTMNTMPESTELSRRVRTEQKAPTSDEQVRPEQEGPAWSLPARLISKPDAEAEGPCTD